MVSVVVVRPFRHGEENVFPGQCIEMEPIDAAVKAHGGLVSLNHGQTYQTREMVAGAPAQGMTSSSFEEPSPAQAAAPEAPPKRRRGRPRKNPV